MISRFERQLPLFGAAGQRMLRQAHVAIVGLGGIGSHVNQQLSYLGVGQLTLLDGDVVEDTNLNRLIGGTQTDVLAATPKVFVAERLTKSIDPDIKVTAHQGSAATTEAVALLANTTFVIGCLDHDGPRLALLTICTALRKPYLDVATDISPKDSVYGGRVIFGGGGSGCLYCLNQLDQGEVRRWMSTDEAIASEDRLYGRRAAGPSPSVVSLNGVLASVACMEFMAETTGLRPARRWLEYDGQTGKLRVDTSSPAPNCPYCFGPQSDAVDSLARLLRLVPTRQQ